MDLHLISNFNVIILSKNYDKCYDFDFGIGYLFIYILVYLFISFYLFFILCVYVCVRALVCVCVCVSEGENNGLPHSTSFRDNISEPHRYYKLRKTFYRRHYASISKCNDKLKHLNSSIFVFEFNGDFMY